MEKLSIKQVEKYKEINLPNLRNQEVFFQNCTNLKDVIDFASSAINGEKKMFSHQKRLGKKVCNIANQELNKFNSEIIECSSFEEIFKITEKVKLLVHGVGDLWSYDTALRIGFYLKAYPKEIYIQAGVKNGIKKLKRNELLSNRKISKSTMPIELQTLEPYEIENFLCVWGKTKSSNKC